MRPLFTCRFRTICCSSTHGKRPVRATPRL
nr:MAG TPA: hypothetical protein [Siphoviridae sp. ctYuc6]